MKTTLNPAEVLTPGKLQVNEGSSATLNWNYSLTSSLVSVLLSSTPQSVSLLISKVTTADDKSIGEFSCELTDLDADKWRRAIQVQVTGKLKRFTDF